MSLEAGLIVLAIGAIIFVYLIWKLVGEYRERKAQRDQQEQAGESTRDEPPGDES